MKIENIQKLYDALQSIKPTSTDIERVTSFCINSFVFLNFFYKKNFYTEHIHSSQI